LNETGDYNEEIQGRVKDMLESIIKTQGW